MRSERWRLRRAPESPNAPVPIALLNALNLAGVVIASALPVSRSKVCAT